MYAKRTPKAVTARASWLAASFLATVVTATSVLQAQVAPSAVEFRVTGPSQRLEMVVNTSRILTLENEIPRVLVNNQEILRIVPLSPNKVQVSALRPGVTQVNLWEKGGDVRTVDVVVFADSRQLELVLQSEFPKAAIRVRPLASSVVLTGYVDRPEVVSRIVRIAEDYYPKVINNISVGGVQQVALHVRVMEVSRSKARSIGFDWGLITGDDFVAVGASGLVNAAASTAGGIVGTGNDTVRFGIVNNGNEFQGFVDFLRVNQLLKVLAEPTLTTVSGRPASFNEGGQFPVIIPQALGVNAVEFKEFGTRVDFVPIVLGNGNIRLEVRPEVSEIDNARGVELNGVTIPGLRTRWVDTAVEMRAGQTLALAGLIQERTEVSSRGLPYLAELPWAGNLFRRNNEVINEIELLVTVRPELVAALNPDQVPPYGPGEITTSPDDCDFYGRGYLEVPRCCPPVRCQGPMENPLGGMQSYPGVPGMPMEAIPSQGAPSGTGAPMSNGQMPSAGYQQPGVTYGQSAAANAPEIFGPSGYDQMEY